LELLVISTFLISLTYTQVTNSTVRDSVEKLMVSQPGKKILACTETKLSLPRSKMAATDYCTAEVEYIPSLCIHSF
jgi:hypothetical protein